MEINVQIKTRSELDVCSYAARGETLIVINSETLIFSMQMKSING